MPVTVLVEPDPSGHRFQAVANVAAVARRTSEVILLTSDVGLAAESFEVLLKGTDIEVRQRFSDVHPPTRDMARSIAEVAREREVVTAVVMDADQSLKKWFWVARSEFSGLGARKPRVIFMLTRYPAKLGLRDVFGWKLRLSKGLLTLLAMLTGTLERTVGFAGREDMSSGWLVKRARDPAICTAHSRDRETLRTKHGLPTDRTLVGIFGVVGERKNAPMILAALAAEGIDADLILAGKIAPEVAEWLDSLSAEQRGHVIVRPGFLPDAELDELVAAADVVPLALTNNGPSGIMGKALAAGVPVVTAGSEVRAREIRVTAGGVACDFSVEALGRGMREVLEQTEPRVSSVPLATADAFAETLLGIA